MTRKLLLALPILFVLTISISMTPALAAVGKDPSGDATNGNPDFDIKKFGMQNGIPYLDVYGTGGGTTAVGFVYAYVFITDTGIFAVTSHGGIEDSSEVGDDEEYHAHLVTLGGDGCVTGLDEDGSAQIKNKRVAVTGTGASSIDAVLTARLDATASGVCVTAGYDIAPNP